MEPQLTTYQKFMLILNLNKITDEKAKLAYIEHRRQSLMTLFSLFLVSKLIHLFHIGTILQGGDMGQYRADNPEIAVKYPPNGDAALLDATDAGLDSLKSHCYLAIGQTIVLIVIIAAALLMIKKTSFYVAIIAWLVGIVQLCELPFWPIFPSWYLVITAGWIFASYFFLTVVTFQTLFQALPILVVLLIGLPLRLYGLIEADYVPYGYLVAFGVLSLAIAVMISIDIVSQGKMVFTQLFEMHRQKECFRTILSSFPEGVLISKVTHLTRDMKRQHKETLLDSMRGQSLRGLQEDQDDQNDSGFSYMEEVSEIRVDVLFMNQHLQKFLSGTNQGNLVNPQSAMAIKRIVPFQFKTKSVIESKRRQSSMMNSEVSQHLENQAVSIEDVLKEGWKGRRFYKIAQDDDPAGISERSGSNVDENVLLEICIKPREFCDMDCKLLIIRNISHVARQEKLQSEYEYQQALIQTRQHEDLTPLNAILNISEMLLDEKMFTDEQKDQMQVIWSSGKLLEFNIQSQLSQMQIEQDSMEINFQPCTRPELSEVINDVFKPFQIVIKERNLVTKVVEQSSIPPAFFIEKKIYSEILYNLFQNAVKYNNPSGQIVTTVHFDKETGKLWTTVEDTGVGIKMNMRQNLFVAFRNAQNTATSRNLSKSGIGIGLSNSKCLAQALGGTIDLQSKPNKGTIVTFSVDIVLKKEKTVVTAEQQIKKIINDSFKIKQTTENEQLYPEDLAPEAPSDNTQTPNRLLKETTPLQQEKEMASPPPLKQLQQQHYSQQKQTTPDPNFISREARQEQRALDRLSSQKKKDYSTPQAEKGESGAFSGQKRYSSDAEVDAKTFGTKGPKTENDYKEIVAKPGAFLPMINQVGNKKKAAKVGLFGDYIDGDDAMLVYDVDSDAEVSPLVRKKSLRRESKGKKQKPAKSPPKDSTPLDRNVVVPDNSQAEAGKLEENTEDMQDSMTKFRVKKPIKMPYDTIEGDEGKPKNVVKFDIESDSENDRASTPFSGNDFDDALIKSLESGAQCNCNVSVLCVDDNAFNLMPMRMILKTNFGLESYKAVSGQEAINIFMKDRAKKCCQQRIQIILMDIIMPEMDGFKTTSKIMDILMQERAIKSYDTSKDRLQPDKMAAEMGVSIVAVTAYIDKPTVDKIYDVGMVEALMKPMKNSQMKSLLSKYYKKSSAK